MNYQLLIQRAYTAEQNSVSGLLKSELGTGRFTEARIAVAYMTVAGLRALLLSFLPESLNKSSWVIGLDDYITQPGAIELLRKLPGATVRFASLSSGGKRFHPKVFLFSNDAHSEALLIVGSANLTKNAMNGNAEAVVALSGGASAKVELDQIWRELWLEGKTRDDDELDKYKAKYEKIKRLRKKLELSDGIEEDEKEKEEILETDKAELDPSLADTCWIECGYITALGRELEFKAEQGLFFGLPPAGGSSKMFRFRTSNGTTVPLRMKYQENHMWRLQMRNSVPEVKIGLRPLLPNGKLGKSPYVARFERTELVDEFRLSFIDVDSSAFGKLLKKSERAGAIGKTTARRYGWC